MSLPGAAKSSLCPQQQVVMGTLGWRQEDRRLSSLRHYRVPKAESAGRQKVLPVSLALFEILCMLHPLSFVPVINLVHMFGSHPFSEAFPDHPVNYNTPCTYYPAPVLSLVFIISDIPCGFLLCCFTVCSSPESNFHEGGDFCGYSSVEYHILNSEVDDTAL